MASIRSHGRGGSVAYASGKVKISIFLGDQLTEAFEMAEKGCRTTGNGLP